MRIGTVVRIDLQGRRVGGWVVEERGAAEGGPGAEGDTRPRGLKPIAKVTGWGPPPQLIDLASWAAWRWAGRRASLLGTATAPRAIRGLPQPKPAFAPVHRAQREQLGKSEVEELVGAGLSGGQQLLRLPPACDVLPLVTAAVERGPTLVLLPSSSEAARIGAELRSAGVRVALHPTEWAAARAGGVSVVGSRAAAWSPMPEVAAVVVVDGHDEAYQEERAPTWHARDVALERADRVRVPGVVVSPCPDLSMVGSCAPHKPSRAFERAGWAVVDVVDRRADDPRTGLFSDRFADAVRRHERVVVVLNRKGRARLLACGACGELARCEICTAAVGSDDDGLVCPRCRTRRPAVCASCGAGRLKLLRLGVTRAAEELQALVGREVGEVTGDTDAVPSASVLIGTEAVLHRSPAADLVAFLDFDQELLASRYRATEQAIALLARAARLVGGRVSGGRVLVQTRLPHHEVIAAALHADPDRVHGPELERRRLLGFPPFTAIAAVSGPAAEELITQLRNVELLGPSDGRWLVKAANSERLAEAFAAAGRPTGRLRIEVDPLRI